MLQGNGDGTFQTAHSYATGQSTESVAVGEFNGDGKLDLAVAGDRVSVLLGNGDGTFQTAHNFTVGRLPRSVAVGDFNGDGKPDLAVTDFYSRNVNVLLGNGDGTFLAAQMPNSTRFLPMASSLPGFSPTGRRTQGSGRAERRRCRGRLLAGGPSRPRWQSIRLAGS